MLVNLFKLKHAVNQEREKTTLIDCARDSYLDKEEERWMWSHFGYGPINIEVSRVSLMILQKFSSNHAPSKSSFDHQGPAHPPDYPSEWVLTGERWLVVSVSKQLNGGENLALKGENI